MSSHSTKGALSTDLQKTLQKTVKKGDLKRLKQLFSNFDVNSCGSNGFSALHYAAHYGAKKLIYAIIEECGGDIDIVTDRGNSAMHIAVYEGHVSIISAMVQLGAYVDCVSEDGKAVVELCASARVKRALDKFIPGGSDVPDVTGYTREYCASVFGIMPSASRAQIINTYRLLMRKTYPQEGEVTEGSAAWER